MPPRLAHATLALMLLVATLGARTPVTAAPSTSSGSAVPAPPSSADDDRIVHLLNRLGYGPRPGDVERVRACGTERYIEAQLHPEQIPDPEVDARLAGLRTLSMSSAEIARTYPRATTVRRLASLASKGDAGARAYLRTLPPLEQRGRPQRVLAELVAQKLIRAVHSERQLHEVMVDFWMNHFNVFWQKGLDRMLLTAYERDVIRPRALGRFRDLLEATAKSPAMLYYLDNWLSSAETPAAAPDARRRARGLNENYAREIMELHTIGVDGGYTQKDVMEVARCFTGWSLRRPGAAFRASPDADISFVFRPRLHDNGQKVVLGHVICAGGGERDAHTVIDILARDPHTARFISLKLCRRFVCDDPPAALVDRVAAVFRATDGDIRAVVRAIVTSPEFRAPRARAAKIKTPLEFVASAIRAGGGETRGGRALADVLARLGMPLYLCVAPTGFADRAEAWVSAGTLLERMSFAVALAENRIAGTRVPPQTISALTIGSPDFQRR